MPQRLKSRYFWKNFECNGLPQKEGLRSVEKITKNVDFSINLFVANSATTHKHIIYYCTIIPIFSSLCRMHYISKAGRKTHLPVLNSIDPFLPGNNEFISYWLLGTNYSNSFTKIYNNEIITKEFLRTQCVCLKKLFHPSDG